MLLAHETSSPCSPRWTGQQRTVGRQVLSTASVAFCHCCRWRGMSTVEHERHVWRARRRARYVRLNFLLWSNTCLTQRGLTRHANRPIWFPERKSDSAECAASMTTICRLHTSQPDMKTSGGGQVGRVIGCGGSTACCALRARLVGDRLRFACHFCRRTDHLWCDISNLLGISGSDNLTCES